ncbi:MAG: class I SAM-dependent methyltransferase [Thermomicrobiales bacterium]
MVEAGATTTGSARRQAQLWGRAAQDWAEHAEGLMSAYFTQVLEQLEVGPGVRLLDIGCGSGVAAAIAADRGAEVHGLDAVPEFVAYGRKRVPQAQFVQGEMEALPYPDDTFDVVTGFNSFQYAADPVHALVEARRVTRTGGSIMITTWGRPAHVDMAAIMRAVAALLPPAPPGAPGPFALSEDGALAALARRAGLQPRHGDSLTDAWDFPDLEMLLRCTLSAGVMTPALEVAGEARVREAITAAVAPFRREDDSYHLESEFTYLIARA